MSLLPHLTIGSTGDVRASFIWLHGLGADGHDFAPVAKMLEQAWDFPVRFILPHAPTMPVTINGGMPMPAWYDMLAMTHPRQVNWDTVEQSVQSIHALIKAEKAKGVPEESIFLAGFSQGGAMALYMGLGKYQHLGGIIALSTYFLDEKAILPQKTPIFLGHGSDDAIIPLELAERAKSIIEEQQIPVEYHVYPMPHSVCPEEISHLAAWGKKQIQG